ncbi:virion structural protein [Betalipothrixvirus uzonense]|uniref:Viral structural protein n=1 Tax=Betalipothrixvirus uzonense TaxID=512792 RepID=B2CRP1_9VIRU|nr:virion structural protein [Acidianus filamentous virus 9]ACB37298.1 viral structural protein [Acidianus filamentous virus 9]
MKLFHFKKEEKTSRSLFVQTTAQIPLEIMVAIGKRHAVGIGEIGDKSATVEKTLFPFGAKPTPEEIAQLVLQKLGVPKSEWEEILKTKKEIVF